MSELETGCSRSALGANLTVLFKTTSRAQSRSRC